MLFLPSTRARLGSSKESINQVSNNCRYLTIATRLLGGQLLSAMTAQVQSS